MKSASYTYTNIEPIQINISEGARALGVSHQRFSRALRALEIPVTRVGNTLLYPKNMTGRVSRFLKDRQKRSGVEKSE